MQSIFRPEQHDLLDTGSFDEFAGQSFTLPSRWYYDSGIFALEHERIFYRNWIYQCHVTDLPNPGDYHVGQVADQSIIVMRGQDGLIRGFYNVCSHRAHPLLEGSGNVRVIVCPYHQWCYEPDGCFKGARGREELKDWIPDHADLKQVSLEDYGGAFVCQSQSGCDTTD